VQAVNGGYKILNNPGVPPPSPPTAEGTAGDKPPYSYVALITMAIDG
jgi:hypothetical protein